MTRHASLNRSFRLVRRADAQVVPVPETACGHGAGRAVKTAVAVAAATTVALAAAAAPPPAATQLPGSGSLAAGQANWQARGATLTVNQSSQRAVIDWQSFNLGSQATIVFNQAAGRAGATLNRVLDSQPSQILGRIQAPGQVFISNPAGVIFGSSARVDVGSLVATSMSLGAADFMAGAMAWQRDEATGAVVNAGALTAADGGYVALMAPEVRNEGVVVAKAGAVALLAGEAIRLEFEGTGLSGVQVSPAQLKTLVENRHAILAPGGLVILSARSADALRSGVVNQAGVIDAGSLVSRGGRVLLEGDAITLATGSRTDAAGATGGGSVLVGGEWQGGGTVHQATQVTMQAGAGIDVSATQQGDGGKAVLWSDTTRAASLTTVHGTIAADGGSHGGDGGRVETSGHQVDTGGSRVSASAAAGQSGKTGLWLIDPTDITIGATEAAGYVTSLQGGTDVLVQTASSGTGVGDITVASEIAWGNNASSTLTLSAARNINLNAPITVLTPNGNLALEYGQGALAASNTSRYTVNAPVTLPAGAHFSTTLGSDGTAVTYTVITALGTASDTNGSTLQGIGGSLTGHYVLGTSIDATAAGAWNSGAGFTPIGNGTTAFTGTLDGLGNSVLNLSIALPTQSYVGLIGVLGTGGIVRNVGAANASVSAQSNVGALVGQNNGAISNTYSSGSVGVSGLLGGGLVGDNAAGTITQSYSSATVSGAAALQVGGLAGNNSGSISYSYASGNVTGHSHTGGLVGYQNGQGAGATITHSYAGGGHVTGTGGSYIGVLTGYANGSGVSTSLGNVTITSAGSFSGWDFTDTWTIYSGRTTPLLSAFLRPVTVGAATVKTYDGNLSVNPASIVLSDPSLAGALLGSLTYSGGASRGAGTYSGVTLGGLFSSQQGARIAYSAPGSLTINPAALTVAGAVAANKVYDGTSAASVTGASLSGVVGGDNVSLSSAGAAFSNKTAGPAKQVTTAYTLTGNAASNYTLAQPTGLTANITRAALTVTGAVAASKVYDGTTTASVSGALAGVVSGDTVGLTTSASFVDKNAGSAKAVQAAVALSGADASNYTVAQPTGLTADITRAALTVTGAVAASKVYDGTTSASVSGASLGGVVSGDTVGLTTSASFVDKNAGSTKAVSATVALSGADATNYTVAQPTGLTADITRAALTLTGAVAASKVYDGTTTASVSGALGGVVSGDTVGLTTAASFVDKNAGSAKAVQATVALSGADATNYTVAQPTGLTADITRAALTLTGAVAASKVYDGTNTASVSGALGGVVSGDTVGLTTSASFLDKNAGSAKAVQATVALSGADATNYTVAQPTGLTADITRAALTLTGAVAASKVYDGTTTASVSGGALGGVVNGESVGLMPAASFTDKNVGTTKPVTATYTLTGTGAGNYTLAQPAGLVADITPASLTVVGGVAASKVYDGATTASVTGGSLSGVMGGDSVGLVASGSFADRNVGSGKVVTATVALAGADAANYIVAPPATLAADITQLGSVAWVGGATGDWFAAGNWAGGAVPTLSNVANVTIPANAVATLANARGSNAPALASLTGAGGVQLLQASLATTGAVALDNVAIGSGATLAAGSLSTSHYNQSGGSVVVAGAFAVNGSFTQTDGLIRAGGAASVRQAVGDLAVQLLVGGSVALAADQGDLRVANVGSIGDVSLAASGSITQAAGGSLTALGKANMVAGGDVVADQARNMVVGSISVQGHDVRLAQGLDDLVLGNVSASGNLSSSAAAGNIRQADATTLTVAGTTSAAAAQGSIYLQAANNAFGGAVSASANDIAVTQGAAPLVLGSVAASRNLAIVSGGKVTQTGALTVAGKASIDAGTQDVTLASTSNDFRSNLAVRAGALTLTDGVGGLLLGNLQTGGATLVQSLDGPILQTGGARFVSTASSTPSFSAWLAGAYASVSLNTDITALINGQMPTAPAFVGSGVASALSVLAPSAPVAVSTDWRAASKVRSLVIPAASPVAED